MVSLPTTMALTLRCFLARSMAARSSCSLTFSFLSIQAPTVTRRSNSVAMPGTSSRPRLERYIRSDRVYGATILRSERICAAVVRLSRPGGVEPRKGENDTLASGPSTFGALDSSRSRVHNPACTQTTHATTPATRRMDRPDGAERLGPEPVPWARPRLRCNAASLGRGSATYRHVTWHFNGGPLNNYSLTAYSSRDALSLNADA